MHVAAADAAVRVRGDAILLRIGADGAPVDYTFQNYKAAFGIFGCVHITDELAIGWVFPDTPQGVQAAAEVGRMIKEQLRKAQEHSIH